MAVVGTILGDIAGSQYEFDRATKQQALEAPLFDEKYCRFTDDTVMTLAVKYAIDNNIDYCTAMHRVGAKYPNCGYGETFYSWIFRGLTEPYNSWGNGSAMRASYIGEYFEDINEVIEQAIASAAVSHNHPEGIKGAVVTAVCVWMAKHGKNKQEIHDYALEQYPASQYQYTVDSDLDELEKSYRWDVSCQGSVPVAIKCFLDSDSYESFLRNVFRLECDADTLGAIGGGVAEEFYHGTGYDEKSLINRYLDDYLKSILYTG